MAIPPIGPPTPPKGPPVPPFTGQVVPTAGNPGPITPVGTSSVPLPTTEQALRLLRALQTGPGAGPRIVITPPPAPPPPPSGSLSQIPGQLGPFSQGESRALGGVNAAASERARQQLRTGGVFASAPPLPKDVKIPALPQALPVAGQGPPLAVAVPTVGPQNLGAMLPNVPQPVLTEKPKSPGGLMQHQMQQRQTFQPGSPGSPSLSDTSMTKNVIEALLTRNPIKLAALLPNVSGHGAPGGIAESPLARSSSDSTKVNARIAFLEQARHVGYAGPEEDFAEFISTVAHSNAAVKQTLAPFALALLDHQARTLLAAAPLFQALGHVLQGIDLVHHDPVPGPPRDC